MSIWQFTKNNNTCDDNECITFYILKAILNWHVFLFMSFYIFIFSFVVKFSLKSSVQISEMKSHFSYIFCMKHMLLLQIPIKMSVFKPVSFCFCLTERVHAILEPECHSVVGKIQPVIWCLWVDQPSKTLWLVVKY